ncbi:MAG: hypothetical protein JWQ98_2558 [Chlorobi bacterium]|nr:hypothetical protein [Chlorobiota bacterium]
MNRSSVFSLRAMIAIAILALVSLMAHGSAFAQPGTPYDVAVSSGGQGAAGEFGMAYSINFNGVAGPVPPQNLVLNNLGITPFTLPANAASIASITVNGVIYQLGGAAPIAIPWAGGCWRLCIRWVWPQRWPWWPRYIIIWYWDPCC